MNKRQIEVQQKQVNNEAKVLKDLKQVYTQASKDCAAKISELSSRTDLENLQSIIYQKQYQEAMKKQIDAVVEQLGSNSFNMVSEYLGTCYEDGFFGTLYDLQGQGVPLCFPINQGQVIQAVQTDSKISKGLYKKMGEDTDYLKKSIRAELSRGVSNGESWNQIAAHIANGMNSPFNKAYNRTKTIARTEGHRVQQEATLHCQQKAKSKGADVVKQWDSTLDGKTRPTHRELDQQIREIEEPFEIAGHKSMFPGGFGTPSEDCNCRCCLLQRARWAISAEEFVTKYDGDKGELVKIPAKSYNEFKTLAKGLGAGNDDIFSTPKHKKAEVIGSIDFSDKQAVKEQLELFEKEAVKETKETACVITKNGTVYKCYGEANRVFPDSDLSDELYGAVVSHNHPIEYTEYSFSKDDISLFMEYKLGVLRGCDELYTYELTWNANEIDKNPDDWMNFENYDHSRVIEYTKELGIGYRRWKNG